MKNETLIKHNSFDIFLSNASGMIPPHVEEVIRNGRYEKREGSVLLKILKGGERILELGGGIGFISSLICKKRSPTSYTLVEANPALIPIIRENHSVNGVEGIKIINGILTRSPDVLKRGVVSFTLAKSFLASSTYQTHQSTVTIQVPALDANDVLANSRPDVLVVDIEGAEETLFDDLDLAAVKTIIIEMHPTIIGENGVNHVRSVLRQKGYEHVPDKSIGDVETYALVSTTAN